MLEDARYARRLADGCFALVALAFMLIVSGALTRSRQAGLACAGFPLCNGRLLPAMEPAVVLAWSHRLLTGAAFVLLLFLGACLLRRRASRRSGLRLWLVATSLALAEIAVGALTVWKDLAAWTVTTHLVLAHAFNASVLLLALRLREVGSPPPRSLVSVAARVWVSVSAFLLLFQVIYGGLVASTFAGLVCPEWPTCNGGIWFPTFRGPVGNHLHHRLTAYLLICALGLATFVSRKSPRLHRRLLLCLAISLVQLSVGVTNVLLGMPAALSLLHSTVAAAFVLSLAVALQEAWAKPSRAGA